MFVLYVMFVHWRLSESFLCRYTWKLLDRVYENMREHNPELSGDGQRTVIRPPQVLRQGTKKTVFANFMDLDDDLVVTQILSRLPFKSLMQFKSVYKPWKSTIEQDSYFIKLHRAHSQRLLRFFSIIPCKKGTKKTVLANFMDVCKSMHREPDHLIMFLLYELGTSGSLDSQHRLVVKGRFMPKNFEGILRRFINEYVICIRCKSPDTILTKKTRLFDLRYEEVTSLCISFTSVCFAN
ncbi:Eukaryotic translation initiation factor 2 subunit beta [Linum grandiflorum]